MQKKATMSPDTYNNDCKNISLIYKALSAASTDVTMLAKNRTAEMIQKGLNDKDRHALLYIVVVLLFYSLGIVIAIVTYLKREKHEIVEEKAYDDYINFRNDPYSIVRKHRVQQAVWRLALLDKKNLGQGSGDPHNVERQLSGESSHSFHTPPTSPDDVPLETLTVISEEIDGVEEEEDSNLCKASVEI